MFISALVLFKMTHQSSVRRAPMMIKLSEQGHSMAYERPCSTNGVIYQLIITYQPCCISSCDLNWFDGIWSPASQFGARLERPLLFPIRPQLKIILQTFLSISFNHILIILCILDLPFKDCTGMCWAWCYCLTYYANWRRTKPWNTLKRS